MARFKDFDWNLTRLPGGRIETWQQAEIAVLMDLRDELKSLNAVFACRNVQVGFAALSKMARLNEIAFKRRVDNAVRKRLARKKRG